MEETSKDFLKDVLTKLENIYNDCKSNKDKRMIKHLIIEIKEWLDEDYEE